MNRIEDVTNYIKEYDDEVGKALELELERQRRNLELIASCLLYTSPSPRDPKTSRMPSSA